MKHIIRAHRKDVLMSDTTGAAEEKEFPAAPQTLQRKGNRNRITAVNKADVQKAA